MPPKNSLISNNPYYQAPSKLQGYTQAAAGISSLLPAESNPYAFDKGTTAIKSGAQGAQLGAAFGGVPGAVAGAAIGAVAGMATGAVNQYKTLDRTQTDFGNVEYDQYGQPVLDNNLAQGISSLRGINSALEDGKVSGFNVGKAERTRDKLSQGILTGQRNFNQANIAYNENLLARQRYEDEMKKNNIYNFPMQLV